MEAPLDTVIDSPTTPERLMPRAAGRAAPVTDWRRGLAALGDLAATIIIDKSDPETAVWIARELAEDIQHAVKLSLTNRFGRIFDPLVDGPA